MLSLRIDLFCEDICGLSQGGLGVADPTQAMIGFCFPVLIAQGIHTPHQ